MIVFGKPDRAKLEHFVRSQCTQPVSYGGGLEPTPGFRYTRTVKNLGSGQGAFERAVAGLEAWAVYPAWLTLYPKPAPIEEGTCVALVAGWGPIRTVSAVRIVAVERTARRFSFTLGTLPQHALSGVERFSVSLEDDGVRYELEAVSKPQGLLVKLGVPIVKLVQVRFAVDSVRSLRRFVGDER